MQLCKRQLIFGFISAFSTNVFPIRAEYLFVNPMSKCNIAVAPLPTHWSYFSFAQSHRIVHCNEMYNVFDLSCFQVNVILLKVIIIMWPAIRLRSINIRQICFVFVLTLKAFRIFKTKFVNRYFNYVWMRYHARIVTFISYYHQIGNTSHCLKLGYETMVCTTCLAICLAMFFLHFQYFSINDKGTDTKGSYICWPPFGRKDAIIQKYATAIKRASLPPRDIRQFDIDGNKPILWNRSFGY